MTVDIYNGWHNRARRVPSQNCDDRDLNAAPEAIIIHCISLPPGQYGNDSVEKFFTNCLDSNEHPYFLEIATMQVSSHFYIQRDGQLSQFVATDKRAWHAGESTCLGRPKVNNFSIGIELEGLDSDPQGFTEWQYNCLTELVLSLISAYPKISKQNIFAHSDIAPGRKPDPGPFFDWQRLFNSLET